jgi:hypothetical protein
VIVQITNNVTLSFDRQKLTVDEFPVDQTLDLDPEAFAIATEAALFEAYSTDGIPNPQVHRL